MGETGENLAAIDIGTNSIHLVVARFREDGSFEVIAQEKEVVRLGSSSGDMDRLTPDAIERGIGAVSRFARIAEISGAAVYAVATSAVREAHNAQEFLIRARLEAGVEVHVVSGTEEARLIYLGVLQAVPAYDRRLVLVDIGGGSTEILVGERGEALEAVSLKLGAIRLTRRFFTGERLHPGAVDACRRHVRAALATVSREVARLGFDVAIGCSGSIETVLAVAHSAAPEMAPVRSLDNFTASREQIRSAVDLLVAAPTVAARRKIQGVEPARGDIALAGALILDEVMEALGIDQLVFSTYALREGALLDAYGRRRGATLHHLRDLRRRSVVSLMELMDDDPAHARHVARLALDLFDQTAAWHGLGDADRELLEAAALLANVGRFVAHSGHHKHSYYVIRSSEHLSGFTDREVELIALVARYHRKATPKAKHVEFARLEEQDRARVRALAGLLRVAIGLDRTHTAAVARTTVARPTSAGALVVEVFGAPGADLGLEVYSAGERVDLLAESLGAEVSVVEGDLVRS